VLAYATTIHKRPSLGIPAVVIPLIARLEMAEGRIVGLQRTRLKSMRSGAIDPQPDIRRTDGLSGVPGVHSQGVMNSESSQSVHRRLLLGMSGCPRSERIPPSSQVLRHRNQRVWKEPVPARLSVCPSSKHLAVGILVNQRHVKQNRQQRRRTSRWRLAARLTGLLPAPWVPGPKERRHQTVGTR
jgi:hypothetical protein